MKTKHVYLVKSVKQKQFLIFGTRKRAKEWIQNSFNKDIFNDSSPDDLYIKSRIVY